jgi:hypothetical protein
MGVLKGEEPFSKFLLAVSNYLPAQSEKFARGQAFTTGYILGRDFKKLEGDQLYRFAKKFTESTMYAYSAADRPRIYTGPMGSVFGMFKNWQAHYIGSMLEYAGEGYARGNWNPLLWQMGGTAALGGVAALPVVGVADAFSRWATDESLMNNIYANFGGTDPNSNFGGPADAIYHGLPTFLGLSLSGSSAAQLSDPSRDASMLFGFVQADRAKALGQALGSAVDVWADTGQHPIQDARTRDLFIKALAPKSFARAASITEDQGLRSLNNGSKIAGNLNTAEQILYTLGLNPRRLAIANEVGEQLWKDQEAHREKITKMGRYWAEAQRERDWDMLHRLQNQALIEGVDIGRVISSARTQTQNQTKNVLDRKYNGRDLVQPRELGLIQ